MVDTTLPDLTASASVAGADLYITRQGADTEDKKATVTKLETFLNASTSTLTNKTINTASNTITIVEADISDLGSYITASSTDTLTNKTFDANGTGNSLSNVETADIASASKSGADTTLITGTAGTASDLAIWNGDGDLVDGPTPPSGTIVGTTDTQTLTNKTLTSPVISDPVLERNLTTEASTSFTIGQIGYVDASGTVSAADASAESTGNKMLVMAQGTVGTGTAADFTLQGFLTTSGLTAGSVYYLSETAKGVTTTAPTTASSVVRVVGYALSTTVFYFNPDGTWVTN